MADDFVCPQPQAWNRIYAQLLRYREARSQETPKVPVALILGAWWRTSDSEKRLRWKETVSWAEIHGASHLLEFGAGDQYLGDGAE